MAMTSKECPSARFIKESILEKVQIGVRKEYTPELLEFLKNANFNMYLDSITHTLIYELKGFAYGSKIVTDKTIEVPDGFFDYLKVSLFPRWLQKKFPPKTKSIAQTITIYKTYPGIQDVKETRVYQYEK